MAHKACTATAERQLITKEEWDVFIVLHHSDAIRCALGETLGNRVR